MSKWYGAIQGNRGEATRMGTEGSGFSAHIRGWNFGVRVHCYTDQNGIDKIAISLTGGSNNSSTIKCLGTWTEEMVKNEDKS